MSSQLSDRLLTSCAKWLRQVYRAVPPERDPYIFMKHKHDWLSASYIRARDESHSYASKKKVNISQGIEVMYIKHNHFSRINFFLIKCQEHFLFSLLQRGSLRWLKSRIVSLRGIDAMCKDDLSSENEGRKYITVIVSSCKWMMMMKGALHVPLGTIRYQTCCTYLWTH